MRKFILSIVAFICGAGIFVCAAREDNKYEVKPQNVQVTDTTTILCIGNSFTYYFDTYNMLSEIAWSQGHYIVAKSSTVGGYSFACHLAEPKTIKAYESRSLKYDVVFLQNQSQLNALIGSEPKRYAHPIQDARELCARIREYAPKARYVFESTWSYVKYNYGSFGSFAEFDAAMLKGTKLLARKCHAEVSPIGTAFALCRERYPEIKLLYKDNHHQSAAGAYLKSCVNYLVIFGCDSPFAPGTSSCNLPADVAQKLQLCAYDAVRSFKK